MDLTDAQWAKLDPLFRPERRADGKGRPWQDTRAVLNGVLWILRTGAPWYDLPDRYPPYQTCHRRFSSGSAPDGSRACCRNWPRTYAIEESWI
jgi:transposase